MRGRVAWCIGVALLAAGCATPDSRADTTATATDQTDVWFMQHMVPHLRQKTAIVSLTRARITHPQLARLADTMARRDQADSDRLLGWLARRGLAPHGHSHQRVDNRQPTDLERLARLRGVRLDLSFLDVMLARDRAGITICVAEVRHGRLPDVRQLAGRMLVDHQREVHQLHAWRRAWSTTTSHHPNEQRPRAGSVRDGDAAPRLDAAEIGRILRQESGRSVAALIRVRHGSSHPAAAVATAQLRAAAPSAQTTRHHDDSACADRAPSLAGPSSKQKNAYQGCRP